VDRVFALSLGYGFNPSRGQTCRRAANNVAGHFGLKFVGGIALNRDANVSAQFIVIKGLFPELNSESTIDNVDQSRTSGIYFRIDPGSGTKFRVTTPCKCRWGSDLLAGRGRRGSVERSAPWPRPAQGQEMLATFRNPDSIAIGETC
jgi:hypothetical protein